MAEPRAERGASARAVSPLDAAKRAIRAEAWETGLALLEEIERGGGELDANAGVLKAIALIRSRGLMAAIDSLDPQRIREAQGRADLRRLGVAPLVKAGALVDAARVLDLLVRAYPESADDRRSYASVLARLKRWGEAIAHVDEAARVAPGDASLLATRIQLRTLAGETAAAAQLARESIGAATQAPDDAHVWMTALLRGGDHAGAANIAAKIEAPNHRVASVAVRALLSNGRTGAAISVGRNALRAGHDSAALRSQLAQAHLARGTHDDRLVAALEHLAVGVQIAPDDLRLNSLYGETLLRAGRFAQSVSFLEKSATLAPELEHVRAMYARALRHSGNHAQSAEQFLHLAHANPEHARWQRAAAGALTQAGRTEEAANLFDAFISRRSASVPATFEQALARIDAQAATVTVPRARLDWAWALRGDQQAREPMTREAWERAAQWGYLVDHLLLDWLECREDRAEEAMELLADLDEAEQFFAPLRESGRGFVVATAHVGPMYGGLMALDLLDIPSRWIASTPGISRSHYARSLISTSDRTEVQVVKASLKALQEGHAVCLAVDGALNPAAARVPFEGQEITWSSFAARACYRLGLPSLFYAPKWEQGRITHTLERLPEPLEDETLEDYVVRWQRAWLAHLRTHIAGRPESLRLSGGLWRHVVSSTATDSLT
ncbi:tetratricopeptide repeat protein [Paraburkholderia pallida]|uniref:Vi polysaccharide transport protein VexE n=1 Tax=Paraburkholderia pallida TaxID=2547399 RepID=A0A4P7CTR9_9BURK|nr:tetratricopeptide repeat protein [Paraburkholderia pallida]QBQ99415.1 Vi polysaccharide transport protein VexE [Paraburkholderia pallida]